MRHFTALATELRRHPPAPGGCRVVESPAHGSATWSSSFPTERRPGPHRDGDSLTCHPPPNAGARTRPDRSAHAAHGQLVARAARPGDRAHRAAGLRRGPAVHAPVVLGRRVQLPDAAVLALHQHELHRRARRTSARSSATCRSGSRCRSSCSRSCWASAAPATTTARRSTARSCRARRPAPSRSRPPATAGESRFFALHEPAPVLLLPGEPAAADQHLRRAARASSRAGGFGFGLGSIILVVNVVLLWGYTLGCHACRHIVGGKLKHFSRNPLRYAMWNRVSGSTRGTCSSPGRRW